MAVLEGRNLTKTYSEGRHQVPVLRGVSLSVARGEVVALVGPSGSGKTTLLSILGCLLTPTSGHLMIDGRKIDAQRTERLREVRRRSIGFVFQQFNLFPSLNARENVEYSLNLKGVRGARRGVKPTGCSRQLASATARTFHLASCPEASASESPWHGRSPARQR